MLSKNSRLKNISLIISNFLCLYSYLYSLFLSLFHVKLTFKQMPIVAGWRDASLTLWDFSRSNKHCIHFSTTKTIYFSRLFLQCPHFRSSHPECSLKKVFLKISQNSQVFFSPAQVLAFASIEIPYSTNVCNKSAAEAWVCLLSFYGGEWWSEILLLCMYSLQNDNLLHWDINVTLCFQYFFHWIKV